MSRAIVSLLLLAGCGSSHNSLSPDGNCQRYLACLENSGSSDFAAELNAYGSSSACWHSGSQAAQSCSQSCADARQQLGASCGCTSDSDCSSGLTSLHCDTTTRQCVQCVKDADCASSFNGNICEQNKCQQCRTNSDCTDGICSTSANNGKICGGCEYITDGCTSPCDETFYCTLGKTSDSGNAWSVCLSDDHCCDQASCGHYAALRACLLANCGTLEPDPTAFDSLAALTLCAEEKCMDSELACHQNAC